MLKILGQIIWNRSQVSIINVLIDILITSLQEFKRSSDSGDLDLKRRNDFQAQPAKSEALQNTDFSQFKNF